MYFPDTLIELHATDFSSAQSLSLTAGNTYTKFTSPKQVYASLKVQKYDASGLSYQDFTPSQVTVPLGNELKALHATFPIELHLV